MTPSRQAFDKGLGGRFVRSPRQPQAPTLTAVSVLVLFALRSQQVPTGPTTAAYERDAPADQSRKREGDDLLSGLRAGAGPSDTLGDTHDDNRGTLLDASRPTGCAGVIGLAY